MSNSYYYSDYCENPCTPCHSLLTPIGVWKSVHPSSITKLYHPVDLSEPGVLNFLTLRMLYMCVIDDCKVIEWLLQTGAMSSPGDSGAGALAPLWWFVAQLMALWTVICNFLFSSPTPAVLQQPAAAAQETRRNDTQQQPSPSTSSDLRHRQQRLQLQFVRL